MDITEEPQPVEQPATPDGGVDGGEDPAAAAAAADAPETVLKGLAVLPPRQRGSPRGPVPALALPPIRPDEPVQSIRMALSEIVGLAHITSFRLEHEAAGSVGATVPWTVPGLVSPYTGRDAVVCQPAPLKAFDSGDAYSRGPAHVLDDYGDVGSAADVADGSAFRLVLQRYDAAAVADHLVRLRSLLQGNPPSTLDLVGEEPQPSAEAQDDADGSNEKRSGKPSSSHVPDFFQPSGEALGDYFFLVNGEDPSLYRGPVKVSSSSEVSIKTTVNKKKKKGKNGSDEAATASVSDEQEMREKLPLWNRLDEKCWIKCSVRYSGYHPPPPHRKWAGDLAYFEFRMANEPEIHITATVSGFYVNRSCTEGNKQVFDPSPAAKACYSHALLDCLLQASASFQDAWAEALDAAKQRSEIMRELNVSSPHLSLFRLAVRCSFGGFSTPQVALAAVQNLDNTVHTPSWLVPMPQLQDQEQSFSAWSRNHLHSYQPARVEEELTNCFGIDLRSGGSRDWNEEYQIAREMPVSTLDERTERARLLYKVMSEFGEAAVLGVKAIAEGQVSPMNPNESVRTQVFLHNNIFISRAIDAGPETFKLHKGDKAARKQANRDLQCNQNLYRMEATGVSSLATVLVDYLGTRYVCQSVLPGILIGDRAHKLIHGAVESGAPLKWDEEFHTILEEKMGSSMMLATRPALRQPLTEKRLAEVEAAKKELPPLPPQLVPSIHEKEDVEPNAIMSTCIPIEAKGIMGSDQRRYLLDIGRLTPRDANWLSEYAGGTGKYENERKEAAKPHDLVPASLDDEEWALCVLRPELVNRFVQSSVSKYLAQKKAKELVENKQKLANNKEQNGDGQLAERDQDKNGPEDDAQKTEESSAQEDEDFINSLKLNVNVFLPGIRSLDGIDDSAVQLLRDDEERVRAASIFLWDEVLPKISQAVKEGAIHQLPVDGKTLTEFIHRNGVNCRYLGRLAVLAQAQEAEDAKASEALKHGREMVIARRTMPKCWLELLECEMVARAAKHVLDLYLGENGSAVMQQPAQTIASFLSALVSESEETAAQTETRHNKRLPSEPDDEDFAALTISEVGGGGDAMPPPVRSRTEVWNDIEAEIGRRFRYVLTLYNTGNKSGRARYAALLRRVCQRTGVRLLAKDYILGGKCLCSGGNTYGGRLTRSYPISPVDIVDIVPLVKHTAASSEGFYPCTVWPVTALPPLQVSLEDARVALERAHEQANARALGKGLECAQEALSLYQRVTESPTHPGVAEALELMATIFHEGGDLPMAIFHADKALSLTIQTCGFDCVNVISSHTTLFQMNYSAKNWDRAIKHLRAAIYLAELMAGPNHIEVHSSYNRLGSTYTQAEFDGQYLSSALKCFHEATKRDAWDRITEGYTAKQFAKCLAASGNYKSAVDWEKKAYSILSAFLSKDHTWAKESFEELSSFTKLAVEQGSRSVDSLKMEEEKAKAEAIAADLLAAEEAIAAHKKNSASKKKRGKK